MGMHSEFIGIRIIVCLCGSVDHHGFFLRNAFESVIHVGRNMNQNRIMFASKELVYLTVCRRIRSAVIKNNFHHAFYNGHIVILLLMIMPSFYNSRVGGRHIHLAELLKHLIINAQDLHQSAPLVRYDFQLFNHDTFDHIRCPHILFAPVFATIFPAYCRDSNVPASLHQPSRISHSILPSLI